MTEKILIHEREFDIVWGDMDALGHVNNARYFDYFQEARIEWLRQHQFFLSAAEGPVVIQIAATFLQPVVYPARLTLKSYIHTPGRSSFFVDHDLYQGEQLMTQGSSKIVWVDYKRNQSIPLPEAIRQLIPQSAP